MPRASALGQNIQEQLLDELAAGSPMDAIEHFFGPIVVMEDPGGELKEFLVIDGQQRIYHDLSAAGRYSRTDPAQESSVRRRTTPFK